MADADPYRLAHLLFTNAAGDPPLPSVMTDESSCLDVSRVLAPHEPQDPQDCVNPRE